MIPKIHFFNPGHETAILQGIENYTPPANVQRMIKELAYLPVWYADPTDYVFTEEITSPRFFSLQPKELKPFATLISHNEIIKKGYKLPQMEATPWGLSPHSCHLFKRLQKEGNLDLSIPEWKDIYTQLTHRKTAADCLEKIRELLPDMPQPVPPKFCNKIKDIEKYLILQNAPFILKTPYSSSGRGLYWLPERKLTTKDRTWIEGAIKKQGCVSIECVLDKQQDIAMEFYSDGKGHIQYEGLSLFSAGEKGAYTGNILGSQKYLESLLNDDLKEQIQQLKKTISEALRQICGSIYKGYLGVDMLIYQNKNEDFAIHPCIEINTRYTMGMVALRISQKYLASKARGEMSITYESKPGEAYARHCFMKKAYPLEIEDGKIKDGYLSLCPVTKDTRYRAYILVY